MPVEAFSPVEDKEDDVSRIREILKHHPHPAGSNGEEALRCIEACAECADICAACADACLAEDNVAEMVDCIRLNLDCADVCRVTGTLITRPSHRDAPALRAQLQACIEMCKACGDHCEQHSGLEHCRICAEACRACADACETMLSAIVA